MHFLHKYTKKSFGENLNELKNKNELLNNLEILLGKSSLDSFPPWLEIEFTNACNLRCFMCYQSNHEVTYTQMDDDMINNVIDILPNVKSILIAGLGEQLLYQKLGCFLENAKHYMCKVNMFTNGHLIDKHLDVFKYVSMLTISFDGATKEVFEAQRYGSDFKKVISNIKLLRKTYPDLKITLGCVVSKLNIDQIEHVVQIACDLGVYSVTFPHVQHAPKIELTKKDFVKIKSQIERAVDLSTKKDIVLIYNDIEYLKKTSMHDREINHGELLEDVNKESKQREKMTPKDLSGLRSIVSSTKSLNIYKQQNSRQIRKKIDILNVKIKKAEEQIREKKIFSISKPYCLAPWNYAFVKMNGNFRLCPYFELEAGNISMFSKGLNVNRLVGIRNSLLNKAGMLSVCETCPDYYHRGFNYETFKNVCGKYGVTINEGD